MEKKKLYSILGDSVSTFAGYTPSGAAFFGKWSAEETGICSAEDTWWMQVVRGMNGKLGVNNSYSGSLVSGGLSVSGTSKERLLALGDKGAPDVILLAMGANDWGFGVLPQEFEYEYRRMLQRMKRLYPKALIYCATLLQGRMAKEDGIMFFNVDDVISPKIYSDIIRKVAREAEVMIADLGSYNVEYETIDGVHPNKQGMQTIAGLWLKELRITHVTD